VYAARTIGTLDSPRNAGEFNGKPPGMADPNSNAESRWPLHDRQPEQPGARAGFSFVDGIL